MTVLLYADERFTEHDTGPRHPERPERLAAVDAGLRHHGLLEGLDVATPRQATDEELHLVHPAAYVDRIEVLSRSGGGHLDPDTVVSPESAEVARLAVGSALDAVDRLTVGEADAAFLAVRPPGHHATATRPMTPGTSLFCIAST